MINNDILNIKTDNIPLLDELIFSLKKITETCVLKNQEQANNLETLESQRDSDLYLACIENRVTYKSFSYDQKDLEEVGIPDSIMDECLRDKNNIPEFFREPLRTRKIEFTISAYVEFNDYYRMLNGNPKIEDKGIKITEDMIPNDIQGIDISNYLHEMTDTEIDILYVFGVIDEVIKLHPDKKYLNYMGSKRISIYLSRTSVDHQLLYVTQDVPREVLTRFKEKIELNRVFTMKTIYSDAFKIGSDYYDHFIRSFILIQTMMDMITELPDMIIKKEIFDIRMVQLILESNGIEFFQEIPFRYQIAMVRNINRLIKFKSTTKNIVDICTLFGFDNIKVFKYYLLKHRNVNEVGEYEFNYTEVLDPETENMVTVEDADKDFELRFIKVPIDDVADDYIQDNSKYIDYDETVETDKYWNADLQHEFVKSSILYKEFNYVQSKYLSVDTLYSMSELSFEMIYFYNMVFDDVKVEELLTLRVPAINGIGVFKFVDILCYLYALMYEYRGVVDDLMDTPTKIMHMKGFNFKANMAELGSYVAKQGYTLEDLGVSDFQVPDTAILSYNQLMDIFTRNKNVHDHIIHELSTANNKQIYDIYKTLYDSLMLTELNMEFFKKKDGTVATTYTDFLRERDPILYNSILQIRNMDSQDVKREKISIIIDATIFEIEQLIDLDKYKFMFAHLPAVSAEAVKYYVYKVVNFFKSYKVDIMSINTVYIFDNKLDNKIKMIDSAFIQYFYHKQDTIDLMSKLQWTADTIKEDRIKLQEKMYIDYTFFIDRFYTQEDVFKDNIQDIISVLDREDNCTPIDSLTIDSYVDVSIE